MMVLMTLWSPMARIGRGGVRYYRDIPAPVRVLSAGMLINRAGGFFNFYLALILADRGMSAREVGAALVVTGAAAVAGAWLGGMMTARFGSRMVIAVALFSSAVFTAGLIPASPHPVVIGIASLAALSNTSFLPAAATLVGRCAPPGRRLQTYSVFQAAFNVGSAIGLALGGFLITHSLTMLLAVDAATSACFVLVALRLPKDEQPPAQSQRADDGKAPGKIRQDPRYLLYCAGVAFLILAYRQNSGPVLLAVRDHHYSLELLGDLFSANAVAVILFQVPLSHLTSKLPLGITLAAGAVLTGTGYLVLLAGFTVPLLIAEIAFWTAGELVFSPAMPAVAAQMSRSHAQGRYQGALTVARSSGQALGPPLGVFAYSAGSSLAWLGSGVVGVAAAVMILVAVPPAGRKPLRRSRAELAASGAAAEGASGT